MTLKVWCQRNGVLPTCPTSECGAVSLISYRELHGEHALLWSLSDYTVSSVCGVVVWLVPKP
jgi:hypothetical protein